MRLRKPGVAKTSTDKTIISPALLKSKAPLRSVTLLIIVIVAALAFAIYHHQKNKTLKQSIDENANTSLINMLKKSKSLDDQRDVTSAYLASGNYAAAEANTKKIAQQSNSVDDYLGLLNICTVRAVQDKSSCIDEAISHIKPQIDKLSFFQVYSTASELDEAGFKKDAVAFYQRAYDIYDPARADAYTKTKDQIKQRIAELNG